MKNKSTFFLISFLLLTSCENNLEDNSLKELPMKINANDNDALSSPINSSNLDEYMFRDDVQYIDLRSLNMVFEEGYICGFSFIPFYKLIGSFNSSDTLFTMITTKDSNNNTIYAGTVGSFVPNYEESIEQINIYFNKDKNIFLLSQGGSESSYMINLLIQLGYDANKLYNVGGVSNNEGRLAYKDVKGNKYFIGPGVADVKITYDFSFKEELTPIKKGE